MQKFPLFFVFLLVVFIGCKSDDYQKAKNEIENTSKLLNDAQTSHEVELIYSDFIKRMSTLHIYDEKENEIIEKRTENITLMKQKKLKDLFSATK